jgi:ketosteroid isomerase-like protein
MVADPKFSKYAGAVVDKHGFRERAASLHEDFEYLGVERIETVAEGDRVVVRNEMHLKRRATGVEFTIEVADFWTVRDGKAVELVEFYDTALADRILQG